MPLQWLTVTAELMMGGAQAERGTVFLAEVCSQSHLFIHSATNQLFASTVTASDGCFLRVYHLLPRTVELLYARTLQKTPLYTRPFAHS